MTPNYVAKKSTASVLSFWLIILFWLIIPVFIQIARILAAKCYSIEFYDEKMVVKSGVLAKKEDQTVFAGVYAVSINQSILGRIFDFADIKVDCPGRWDVDTTGIKNPTGLKSYLQERITASGLTSIVHN